MKTNLDIPKGIEKRGKHSYRFTIFLGMSPDGKRIEKRKSYKASNTARTKLEKELTRAFEEFKQEVEKGVYSSSTLTFNDFYKTWLKEYAPNDYAEYEVQTNEQTIKREFLPLIGAKKIKAIDRFTIQRICDGFSKEPKCLKASTKKKYIAQLSAVFRKAVALGIISVNPCDGVTFGKTTKSKEVHAFTIEESKRFLLACKTGFTVHHDAKIRKNERIIPEYDETISVSLQFNCLFNVLLLCGLRRGEAIGLKWRDIDFNSSTIDINHAATCVNGVQKDKDPKTVTSKRCIPAPQELIAMLQTWKETQKDIAVSQGTAWVGMPVNQFDEQYIFITENGAQMSIYTPEKKFHNIISQYNSTVSKELQLPRLKLHDLRHCCASILISQGVPIEYVSSYLGHSSITVTYNVYVHLLGKMDNSAPSKMSHLFFSDDMGESGRKMGESVTKQYLN